MEGERSWDCAVNGEFVSVLKSGTLKGVTLFEWTMSRTSSEAECAKVTISSTFLRALCVDVVASLAF